MTRWSERASGSSVGARGICPDLSLVLEQIASGASVAEVVRQTDQLVAPAVEGNLIVGYSDPELGFVCHGPALGADALQELYESALVRPTSMFSRQVDAALRHEQVWDDLVRKATRGRFQTAWVVDFEQPDPEARGRLVFLSHVDRALGTTDREILERAVDLITIAVGRDHLQARINHGALHDEVTGLANRRLLLTRVGDTFDHDHATGGVLFVDLDRFKLVNDGLGHAAGDQLLREVAARFHRTARSIDLVARVGGDEFVVLCPDLESEAAVERAAERFAVALQEPVSLPGAEVVVSASIGVTHVRGRVDATALLRDADLAMYDAKQRGGNRIAVFHRGLRDRAASRLEMENALRDAISSEEMELHFQPVVRLCDGAMIGVESLLRWQRPGVGMVEPDTFVPVATDTGLIIPLGRWVIEQAVAAAARWPGLEVAANLAARQLNDPDLVGFVQQELARHEVAPERLCLEVTEADLMADSALVVAQLTELKALGVRLAIDDFGTGFATLDYLRRFAAADILKIDASFVAGVTDPSSHDLAIVSAAMVLADNLGFRAVAEGVETEGQRDILVDLGCEFAQGYLFSHAVTSQEIDALLTLAT